MANPETQPDFPAAQLIRCPCCPVRLTRQDIIKHLWLQHRLLLDGSQAREPWTLIAEWVNAYYAGGDVNLLARAFQVAQHVDPDQGEARLRQLLATQTKEGARPDLFAEAERRGASYCPHCFALVPLRVEEPAPRLNVSHGRLSLAGYCVEVSERGLMPSLTIETPEAVLYRGREEGARWTRRGLLVLLVWPPALAALVLAVLLHLLEVPAAASVLFFLVVAVLAYLFVNARSLLAEATLDRAVDHAWTRLAPQLHAPSFSTRDAAFLAGLAMLSAGRGQAGRRERSLERVVDLTEKALAADTASAAHLAALRRLTLLDAATLGSDPVVLVARQLSRCLEGVLPFAFADHLLAEWESDWWTRGNLARLRVQVCARAFDAGFEVVDLVEVGQLAPALGDVLGSDKPEALAQLRFLWSIRATRPWTRCGEAATVFELTEHATNGAKRLETCPDLLVAAAPMGLGLDTITPAIQLCARGVLFGDQCLTEVPRAIEVRGHGAGYELIVGTRTIPFAQDPDRLARRLEKWCQYYFNDFLPQTGDLLKRRSSAVATKLRTREGRPCPRCQQIFLARRCGVGIKLVGSTDVH